MKNKIVIIGANNFQMPLIIKAKELGYETHAIAWREGAVGAKYADYFYDVSITELEKVLKICKEINPVAVCTIASDLANITVNYVAEKLGLINNGSQCLTLTTNKYSMRKALNNAGLSVPEFTSISSLAELDKIKDFTYPLIVKPTDRSGSRGIFKCNSLQEVISAINTALPFSFEKKVMVEEFITGKEFSCECVSFNGEHNLLAVTEKFTTGAPNFIETGHIERANLTKEQLAAVKDTVFKALSALKVKYGASHSEFMLNENNEVKIVEIGSRMGGDCIGSDLVYSATGIDFLKAHLDAVMGIKPDITPEKEGVPTAIRFVFSQKDLEILKEIEKSDKFKIIYQSEMNLSGKIVDSGSRFGYYIFTANTYGELKTLMEQ